MFQHFFIYSLCLGMCVSLNRCVCHPYSLRVTNVGSCAICKNSIVRQVEAANIYNLLTDNTRSHSHSNPHPFLHPHWHLHTRKEKSVFAWMKLNDYWQRKRPPDCIKSIVWLYYYFHSKFSCIVRSLALSLSRSPVPSRFFPFSFRLLIFLD